MPVRAGAQHALVFIHPYSPPHWRRVVQNMISHAKPFLSPVSFHFIFVLRFLNFTDAVIHLPVHPASQTHKFPKRCKI